MRSCAAPTRPVIQTASGIVMKRLSPMQRGYMMGLRRARAQAQRELNDQAERFEDVIAENSRRDARRAR